MKLIPFVIKQKESARVNTSIVQFFLTEGGKDVWEIGTISSLKTIQEEFLEPNGFACESLQKEGDFVFAKLDPARMNLNDFYTWEELQVDKKKEDCFRTFFFCEEKLTQKDWFFSELLQTPFEKTPTSPSALFRGLKSLYYK